MPPAAGGMIPPDPCKGENFEMVAPGHFPPKTVSSKWVSKGHCPLVAGATVFPVNRKARIHAAFAHCAQG